MLTLLICSSTRPAFRFRSNNISYIFTGRNNRTPTRSWLQNGVCLVSRDLLSITTPWGIPRRAFHSRSLLCISKEQIEKEPDIRILLDDYAKPELPPEERETRLKGLISELKSLNPNEERPSEKELNFSKMAHVYRGKALSEMNKLDEALAEIDKGEQLAPDSVLYFEKARILAMLKQYSLAIRYLSKTIDELIPGDPLYVESLLTRAQCYSLVESLPKSIQDVKEVLCYQPHNWKARLELGRFYLEDDNLDAAVEEYETVLDDKIDKSTEAETYFRLGFAFLKKGEIDVAFRSLKQSQKIEPSHPRVTIIKDILEDMEKKIVSETQTIGEISKDSPDEIPEDFDFPEEEIEEFTKKEKLETQADTMEKEKSISPKKKPSKEKSTEEITSEEKPAKKQPVKKPPKEKSAEEITSEEKPAKKQPKEKSTEITSEEKPAKKSTAKKPPKKEEESESEEKPAKKKTEKKSPEEKSINKENPEGTNKKKPSEEKSVKETTKNLPRKNQLKKKRKNPLRKNL